MIRYIANLVGLAVITWLLPGISMPGGTLWSQALVLAGVALILTLMDSIAKPILQALSCGFIVLTLGLFLFVINSVVLLLTSWVSTAVGLGWQVSSFWWALLGSIILAIVASVTEQILSDRKDA